ncbi:MAG: MATE family efflux transporter [Schwartzia sp.]|nr:MATE family efflux transporter [Schwartzia sp. (in: firmicutes)]
MAKDMTEGSPARLILFFALPLIAGNMVQQMYAFVDTFLVGRFLGVEALAAVGCTGCLMFLMIGFVMGMTTGFAIKTGQAFGAKDPQGVRRSAAACAVLSVGMAAGLMVFGLAIVRPVLVLLDTPPEIFENAVSFISIIYAGIPLMSLFAMQTNLIRALGDSRVPTLMLSGGLIINIAFEPLFILGFGLGVPGAALATAASQVLANLICFLYIRRRVPALWVQREDWRLTRRELWEHIRIGIPMGFQTSVVALGAIILQGALNGLGPKAIAAYAAAQRVDAVAVMPLISFGMAMATYTAQNYGARRLTRIRAGVRSCVAMSVSFSILVAAFNILCGGFLMEGFVGAEEQDVIGMGRTFLTVNGLFYWLLSLIFIFRFTLQGLGQTLVPTFAGFMELLMRTLAALFLIERFGYLGACYANPMAWFGACVPLTIAYLVTRKTLREDGSEFPHTAEDTAG